MALSVTLSVLLGLSLTACSASGDAQDASASSSPSPTSTVSVPDGVELTAQGSDLAFGDSAEVIFEPTQNLGTTLRLSVGKAVQGSVKDFENFALDDAYARKASYYYVDVTVKNVGAGDVGGSPVPLWGVSGKNVLLPAVKFTTNFPACPSTPLPRKFERGDSVKTCLVYLSPNRGSLEAVSFRPDQTFDPITWTGEVRKRDKANGKPAKSGKSGKPGSNQG